MLTLVLMLTNLELRVPCAILALERELGLPSSQDRQSILALEQELGRYSRSRARINQGLQLKVKLGKN